MFPKSDKNEFTLIERTWRGIRRVSVVQVFERGCAIPPDFDADPRTGWLNRITFNELLETTDDVSRSRQNYAKDKSKSKQFGFGSLRDLFTFDNFLILLSSSVFVASLIYSFARGDTG